MTVTTIISFIVILGVLIFVHELGHFLVAKGAGVGVLKFSLGFGRRLFGFRRGETEYLISAVPLGGYVKMVGEDPRDVVVDATGQAFDSAGRPLDLAKSFAHKSVWARIAIVLAGPGANFLLAVLLFWGVFALIGRPVFPPVAGRAEAGSPAAVAGLEPGDRIVAVGGRAVGTWEEIEAAVEASGGEPLRVQAERSGVSRQVTITPRRRSFTDLFGDEHEAWNIGVLPFIPTTVSGVVKGLPAAEAGIQVGDRVVAVDGEAIETWDELQRSIQPRSGREVTLTIEREERRFQVTMTPKAETRQLAVDRTETVGVIGITRTAGFAYQRVDPVTALVDAGVRTVTTSVNILWVLVKMVEGRISPRTIGGPILMAQMTGEQVQQGLLNLVFFTALLSINLGVLNLLPVPILDGGHLLFFGIEVLRGQPVSVKKREIAQRVGLVLLVALMMFAFYNDIFRLLGRP